MPDLYYLVLWKSYLEEENTWEPSSVVIHLQKLISTFYKKHPEKPTTIFPPLDSILLMARPMVLKKQQPK